MASAENPKHSDYSLYSTQPVSRINKNAAGYAHSCFRKADNGIPHVHPAGIRSHMTGSDTESPWQLPGIFSCAVQDNIRYALINNTIGLAVSTSCYREEAARH